MSEDEANASSQVKATGSSFKEKLNSAIQNNILKTAILFGPQGSGKTTLLHYLNEDQLIVQNGDRGPVLKVGNYSQIPGNIGNGINSETSEPNLYYNQRTRILYVDCSEQEDTQNQASAFNWFNIFSSCQNKILLYIISEYELQGRAVGFHNSLKQLLKLFESKTEDLKHNCILVFTMKNYIQDFGLAIRSIGLDPLCMEFLAFLIANSRIINFPHPFQFYGRLAIDGDVVPEIYKNEILAKIAELPGMEELQKSNVPVINATIVKLENPEDRIKKEFYDYLDGYIKVEIENKANEIVILGQRNNMKAETVKNQLLDYANSLDAISRSPDYSNFIESITYFCNKYAIQINLSKLQNILNFITQLRQLQPQSFPIPSFIQAISQTIGPIKTKITAISNYSQNYNIENDKRIRPELLREYTHSSDHMQGIFKQTTKAHYNYYQVYDNYHRQVVRFIFTLPNYQRVEFVDYGEWQCVGEAERVLDHTDWEFTRQEECTLF